jgi:hypothetical protein
MRFRHLAPFVATLCLLVIGPDASADILYGISGAGGGSSTLYTIDPTSGAVSSTVGTVTVGGTGVMVTSIAFSPIDSKLYGVTNDPVSGKAELVTINTGTGVAAAVGNLNTSPPNTSTTALAFATNGTLFGYVKQGSQPESLFTINTGTGAATPIGASGVNPSSGDGMAMNSAGTLYFAGKGASGTLYTLNTSTGAATPGPTLSNAPLTTNGQIKGMVFDSGSTLFAINLQTGTFNANLVTIDPVTGILTNIGSTQNGLSGLADLPAAVPEPSSLALAAAAALAWAVRNRFGTCIPRRRRMAVSPA